MSSAVVTYPFVRAHFDKYGYRASAALAFVVHMAEGGNTVAYLHRLPARGVSVHFVIERSGRIVQMLPEEKVSGSINPDDLCPGNARAFVGYNDEVVRFGATARKRILGPVWERNPNHAVITCEVEGFAADGPNLAQRIALRALSRDLAKRHPKLKGLLGHRDFTSRKACPGQHINWAGMFPTKKHG